MPASIHSDTSFSLFVLCAGDKQSAQLLAAWQDNHHSMDHHIDGPFAGHGFELCEFDALSLTLADFAATLWVPVIFMSAINEVPALATATLRPVPRNHPARAPPSQSGFLKHSV